MRIDDADWDGCAGLGFFRVKWDRMAVGLGQEGVEYNKVPSEEGGIYYNSRGVRSFSEGGVLFPKMGPYVSE